MKKKTKSKFSFLVNTLGEVYRGEEYVMGDLAVVDVARVALTPPEFVVWKKLGMRSKRFAQRNARVDREFSLEFERAARQQLSPQEYVVYQQLRTLQVCNGSQFRTYGGLRDDGKPYVVMVCEFIQFVANEKFWLDLNRLAKKLGAAIATMATRKHLDSRGSLVKGKKLASLHAELLAEGRKLVNKGKPDEHGYVWSTGPGHGRLERQVEMIWNVTKLKTVTEITDLQISLRPAVDEFWKTAGLGVI